VGTDAAAATGRDAAAATPTPALCCLHGASSRRLLVVRGLLIMMSQTCSSAFGRRAGREQREGTSRRAAPSRGVRRIAALAHRTEASCQWGTSQAGGCSTRCCGGVAATGVRLMQGVKADRGNAGRARQGCYLPWVMYRPPCITFAQDCNTLSELEASWKRVRLLQWYYCLAAAAAGAPAPAALL
jgi:hypothetical protein